jgi:hypothetical protein
VFIDQSGANPNVNMLQDGSGNKMGTAADPVYLRGQDQKIQASQMGDQNTLALSVRNPDSGTTVGATVQVRQIGDSNTVDIACGVGTLGDGVTALTGCRSADINVKIVGDTNTFQSRATGESISKQYDVSGTGNEFYIDVSGNDHSQTVKVVGDNNIMNVTQISSLGSSLLIDHWGNNNTFTISQSGTVSNVIDLRSVSTSGSFTVIQRN